MFFNNLAKHHIESGVSQLSLALPVRCFGARFKTFLGHKTRHQTIQCND
jgi:hypothetical protein